MSHEIESTDVCITRTNDAPAWHHLDIRVPEISAQVLREQRFARRLVAMNPCAINPATGGEVRALEYKMIIDTAHNQAVSVVGSKYAFPEDGYGSLVRLIEPLLDQGLVKVVSAGTLRGYQKAYITCELDSSLQADIMPGDDIKHYWTLTDALTGKHASNNFDTCTRIVCANTLAEAYRNAKDMRSVRHSQGFEVTREGWRDVILVKKAKLEREAEAFRALAAKQVNQAQLEAYLRDCLDLEENATSRKFDFAVQTHDADSARGTMWGAYNAAQATLQWFARSGRTETANMDNMFFGQGVAQNQAYLQAALSV